MADGLAVGCSCSQGNIISESGLDQESANYSLFVSVNEGLLEHGQLLPRISSVASSAPHPVFLIAPVTEKPASRGPVSLLTSPSPS